MHPETEQYLNRYFEFENRKGEGELSRRIAWCRIIVSRYLALCDTTHLALSYTLFKTARSASKAMFARRMGNRKNNTLYVGRHSLLTLLHGLLLCGVVMVISFPATLITRKNHVNRFLAAFLFTIPITLGIVYNLAVNAVMLPITSVLLLALGLCTILTTGLLRIFLLPPLQTPTIQPLPDTPSTKNIAHAPSGKAPARADKPSTSSSTQTRRNTGFFQAIKGEYRFISSLLNESSPLGSVWYHFRFIGLDTFPLLCCCCILSDVLAARRHAPPGMEPRNPFSKS